VDIDQRIPQLSDKELEILHANAVRLAGSGTQQQRQRAESLLPLLVSELESRRANRPQSERVRKHSTVRKKSGAADSP
jgi:hypothetical protein